MWKVVKKLLVVLLVLVLGREIYSYQLLTSIDKNSAPPIELTLSSVIKTAIWVENFMSFGYIATPMTGRCSLDRFPEGWHQQAITADYFGCDKFQRFINRE